MDALLSHTDLRWFTILSKILDRDNKKEQCFCAIRHWITVMDKEDSEEEVDTCPEDILAKYHRALRQHATIFGTRLPKHKGQQPPLGPRLLPGEGVL